MCACGSALVGVRACVSLQKPSAGTRDRQRESISRLRVVQQNCSFPFLLAHSLSLCLTHTRTLTEKCACSMVRSVALIQHAHTGSLSLHPTLALTHEVQRCVETLPLLMCKSFCFFMRGLCDTVKTSLEHLIICKNDVILMTE